MTIYVICNMRKLLQYPLWEYFQYLILQYVKIILRIYIAIFEIYFNICYCNMWNIILFLAFGVKSFVHLLLHFPYYSCYRTSIVRWSLIMFLSCMLREKFCNIFLNSFVYLWSYNKINQVLKIEDIVLQRLWSLSCQFFELFIICLP